MKARYDVIYRDIRESIETGAYPYQAFLPSEAELTAAFECSHNTIRRALGLLREQGYSLYDSIIHGSLDRLNPILMTALSSALALIPLAIHGDLPGNEIQSPMAKVILGGLLTSTFLNGFIVPIMYWWLHKKEEKKNS